MSAAILWISLVLAFASRTAALSTYGFSEDEVAKLEAIDAYRQGHFSANAEHPMLMKLVVWASMSVADAWNATVPASLNVAPEAALRLPNALAGTATVGAMYGISRMFFGPAVAALTAVIVALDPNVIGINRIGKEDTFLMCFFMLAVYCYERAKRIGASDPAAAQPWYYCSGVAFGLMFASKYTPYFFGLYAVYNIIVERRAGANVPRTLPYNGLIVITFFVANFAALLPSTWEYMLAYVRADHAAHHGYLYNGQLYVNSHGLSFAGIPATYYLHLFGTKVPLGVLLGGAIGLWLLITQRRERGFVWLRVQIVPLMLSYSMFSAKFQRYALPLMLAIDMLGAVGLVTALAWLGRRVRASRARVALCTATLGLVAVPILLAPLRVFPFYSVYRNAIGAALAPAATAFPEEAYRYGVREAVAAIAAVAQPGAAIVSDATLVVRHYLEQSGRADLHLRVLSQEGLAMRGEQWVIVQDSHMYFENASLVWQLRHSLPRWREYRMAGSTVLEVFRVAR